MLRFLLPHSIAQTTNREYSLRMSYLEIYNEVIRDLLTPGSNNLKIHETPDVCGRLYLMH